MEQLRKHLNFNGYDFREFYVTQYTEYGRINVLIYLNLISLEMVYLRPFYGSIHSCRDLFKIDLNI